MSEVTGLTRWVYNTQSRIRGAGYAMSEQEWLNSFGQNGWELVTTYIDRTDTVYIFKRPE